MTAGHRISATLDADAAEQFVLAIAANELIWDQIAVLLHDFSNEAR
ncbi:hypothetical protein [Mycobacterium intracellulare]|nr:hypothetical protein [Mycobacterium intracellulare]